VTCIDFLENGMKKRI